MSTLINLLKKREVVLFLLLFLVSSLSFAIGYYMAKTEPAPIIIERAN